MSWPIACGGRLSRRLATAAACVSCLLIGCADEPSRASPEPERRVAEAPIAEPSDESKSAQFDAADPPWTASSPPPLSVARHDGRHVFGYILVPAPGQALGRARAYSGDPDLRALLTPEGLRAMLQLVGELPGEVARAIDIERPWACVLLDFKAHARPYVCSFAYQGGPKAFVSQLDPDRVLADPQGHHSRIALEPQVLYVDTFDADPTRVVVSFDDAAFSQASSFLEREVLARAEVARGDVEFVVYPTDIFAKHGSRIDAIVEEGLRETDTSKAIAPATADGWESAVQSWRRHNQASTRRLVTRLGKLDQLSTHVEFSDEALLVGFSTLGARDGASPILAGAPVDSRWRAEVPESSFVVASIHVDHGAMAGPETTQLRRAVAGFAAEITQRPRSELEVAFERALLDADRRYSGENVMALAGGDGSPISATWLRVKAAESPAAEGRIAWAQWSAGFASESVLTPDLATVLTWSFETIEPEGSLPATDRWTLRATPAFRQRLDASARARNDGSLLRRLANGRVDIDRWEWPDRVEYRVTVLDDTTEDAAPPRAPRSASTTTTSRVRNPGAVATIDARRTIAWLRSLSDLFPELAALPADVGGDLSLVTLASHRHRSGRSFTELSIDRNLVLHLTRPAPPPSPEPDP